MHLRLVLAAFALAAGLLAALPAASGAAARTVVLRHGPVNVGAFATEKPKVIVKSPDHTGYITQMTSRLVDARGRAIKVDRVMLHHVVFLNQGRFPGDRKTHCGARWGQAFYGTGEETQSLHLPNGFGYRIHRGDRWKMQTMLMSHQNRSQKVYVEYRMRVVTGRRMTPVTPYWVRVTECQNEPSYSIPGGGDPGEVARRTNGWRVPRSGRIVAAGAHLHGGSYDIYMNQPRCENRKLLSSTPSYGMPDDIVYNVKPTLHEPGPINTGWYESNQGVAITKGEKLTITAEYDAERPHPGVMGVMHVYVAPPRKGAAAAQRCAPLPTDARETRIKGPVRKTPPAVHVPLTTLDARGRPVTLAEPKGREKVFGDDVEEIRLDVDFGVFKQPKLSVAAGSVLTWKFSDPVPHKVSLANGPRSVGSPTLTDGKTWSRPFTVPGTYQLFCYLHPMTMHQQVTVRDGKGATAGDAAARATVPEDGTYY